MKLTRNSGFSLLELLIVLAIVGIMASVAIYALGVSRSKSRDAKRVSDISVLRSALSQSWLQKATYPISPGVDLGRPGQNADGLTTDGFVGVGGGGAIILPQVPVGPKTKEYYHYKGTATGYSLKFVTERETAYGPAGTYYGHAGGVDGEDVVK